VVKSGQYRGEKIRYSDGVGCCVWKLLNKDDEDSSGDYFDFPYEERQDVVRVVLSLDDDEEKIYEPECKEYQGKLEERRKKWWWRLHRALVDVGIQIVPFDWQVRCFLITRTTASTSGMPVSKWCKGFHVGPLVVTW